MPRRKRTDAVVECERARTAQRAQKKRLDGIDRTGSQLRHLVGFAHRGKEREARAGADIRPQANMYGTAWITCRAQRKQATAEEQVRGGTMRERGAAGVAAFEFRFVQMHSVREHRAPTSQAVVSVDVEIIAPLREQLHHPRNLIVLLSDMGLHESPGVLAPESACELQLFRGAAPRVPWRNGVETAPSPVPLVDQRLRLVVAGASGIGEGGGCVAVHQDLAGNEPEVVPFRLRKKRVDRARMH